MGSDFYHSSDYTFRHDACYPSLSLCHQFPHHLTQKWHKTFSDSPSQTSQPPSWGGPLCDPQWVWYPHLLSAPDRKQIFCNTILLGTSQIVLETLLQIPITIHLPVKIIEYIYVKFWAISIFILILLKDLSPREMIQMIFLYYLVQTPLVFIEYLCVPGTVLFSFRHLINFEWRNFSLSVQVRKM